MHNSSSRVYSYDDQVGDQPGSPTSSHYPGGTPYVRGYHQTHGSGQFYVQHGGNAEIGQADPYMRSMTPMVQPTHHYSSSGQQRYYQYPGSGGSSSQVASPIYTGSTPYAQQYPRSQTPGLHTSEAQYVPTPSDMYSNYPPRQISVPPHSPTQEPYHNPQYPPPHSIVPSSRTPEQRQRAGSARPLTSPGSPVASPSGERFPCERCGKTFSRSHDRKRHHETQHLTSPVIHRCRYCEKEFSRADSLKRHLDNGCDEMPS